MRKTDATNSPITHDEQPRAEVRHGPASRPTCRSLIGSSVELRRQRAGVERADEVLPLGLGVALLAAVDRAAGADLAADVGGGDHAVVEHRAQRLVDVRRPSGWRTARAPIGSNSNPTIRSPRCDGVG